VIGRTQPCEPTAAAVVLASGAGTRTGSDINKAYLPLAERPLVTWSLDTLGSIPEVGMLLLVTRPQDAEHATMAVSATSTTVPIENVTGGSDRQESELFALRHLAPRIDSGTVDAVLLHDAARPLATAELGREVLRVARNEGGAVPGVECRGLGVATADGECLHRPLTTRTVRAQTPQGFRACLLRDAYEAAAAEGFSGTDTASCVERFTDAAMYWVLGEHDNIKITFGSDVAAATRILTTRSSRRP